MINTRLEKLQKQMKDHGFDAVIFPSNDPHQSEYVGDRWKIREYFSGFTGSAGTLVVSDTEAALWTDSRYFLQVEKQCAASIVELHKQQIPHAPEHVEWLCNELPDSAIIGVDFLLFSCSQIDYINNHSSAKGIKLKDIGHLVDSIWLDRPEEPSAPISDHPVEFCGVTRETKLGLLRTELNDENADYYFISSLDEIAWLLNIRSNDVDFTPLVMAYVVIGKEITYLFCNKERISGALQQDFEAASIEVKAYSEAREFLKSLSSKNVTIADNSSMSYACFSAIPGTIIHKPSLVQYSKSVKNPVEIENAKDGMLKDGIALTRFFIWLENHLENNTISEYEIGIKLESFRKKQELYSGQSFANIVGYKGNGAIIHYSAPENGSAIVSNEGMLLIDSGAQYENATTDITRTIWLGGEPSKEEKQAYTLVLKGYIELEQMQFPEGTTGMHLDSFARMHLWKHGLNYGHGTGHGIGIYSMVHEPGQGFSPTATTSRGTVAHEINQLSTIEPGFYKENAFGIRTENIVVSQKRETTAYGTFLGFEPITLCFIDTQLLDDDLLLAHEIEWLNKYHAKVYSSLQSHLSEEERIWLKEKCKVLS